MKRILILCACFGALALGACTSDSQLPSPTGKGTIRAVNAMPDSPEVRFLIEERLVGSMVYKASTAPFQFDDFEYNFNFEIRIPGESEPTRVATEVLQVEKDREFTFVVTGDYMNPDITVWAIDKRELVEGATTFEIRFAHLLASQSTASVDVYYDETVEPAVVSNKIATLAYGEVSAPQEFETGDYTMTITAAGDVNNVLYSSGSTPILANNSYLAMAFDGDANDTSPIVAAFFNSDGVGGRVPDARSLPTARFIHAAYSLPTADVYNDDVLTSQVVAGLAHGDATGDIDVPSEEVTYYWTPAGSTATILFEDVHNAPIGRHATVYTVGATDEWRFSAVNWDRTPNPLYAKLNLFNAALNIEFIDVYALPAGETIDDEDVPIIRGLPGPNPAQTTSIIGGSYDLVVTAFGEKTVLSEALPIDIADGDAIEVLVLDTADPNVLELRLVPAP